MNTEVLDAVPELDENAKFVDAAVSLFGRDWQQIAQACIDTGEDFPKYVTDTTARLKQDNDEVVGLIKEFQSQCIPDIWPCINSSIALSHQIENVRRGLMNAMQGRVLEGQAAGVVTQLFGALVEQTTNYISATVHQLCGRQLCGFDEATCAKRLIEPYQNIMNKKQAIFQWLGDENMAFAERVQKAMFAKMQLDIKNVGQEAANEPAPAPAQGIDPMKLN
jgi:hypothetical protein